MATRFYLPSAGSAATSPAFDANWEVTVGAVRFPLQRKTSLSTVTALADSTVNVPITTTQDVLVAQFVSDSIPSQRITGIFSTVIRFQEVNSGTNAHFAYSLRVINDDGTVRGTLTSSYTTNTEIPVTANAATRIFGNGTTTVAITEVTTLPGDRLVFEVGFHAAAPTVSNNASARFGTNAASDFALTTALITDLNPWMELSQNIWAADNSNYQFVKVGDGMSVSEKLR